MIILTMFYLLFERAAYLAFCVCSTENYGKGEPQPQSLLVPPAFRDSAKKSRNCLFIAEFYFSMVGTANLFALFYGNLSTTKQYESVQFNGVSVPEV